jgi:hypothetical protein
MENKKNFASKVLIKNTRLNMAIKGGLKLGPLLKIWEESKYYWIFTKSPTRCNCVG